MPDALNALGAIRRGQCPNPGQRQNVHRGGLGPLEAMIVKYEL
ncbi:MAG: hypothetical protein ABSF90_18360 [Syntrophobacteraceae bacterium]